MWIKPLHFMFKPTSIRTKNELVPYFLQPCSGSHSDWLQSHLSRHRSPKEGKGHCTEQLGPKTPGGQALIYFETSNKD